MRRPNYELSANIPIVIRRHKEGVKAAEIARSLDCSASWVQKVIKREKDKTRGT